MGAARRRGHCAMRLCCAKESASAAQACRRGPGAASTASTPGALVCVRRSAEMMREAQRRVVSNWEARWTRGGFRDRVPDRSTGSAPARSGSEPSFSSTCPSPPSLPRRASEAARARGCPVVERDVRFRPALRAARLLARRQRVGLLCVRCAVRAALWCHGTLRGEAHFLQASDAARGPVCVPIGDIGKGPNS